MIDHDDEFKKKVEAKLSPSNNESAARNALAFLFPSVERVLKTYIPSNHGGVSTQKVNRRISQKDFSAAYFSLNPDPTSWGRTEFDRLINEGPKGALDALHRRTELSTPPLRARMRRLFLELLGASFGAGLKLTQEWLDTLIDESRSLLLAKDTTAQLLFTIDNEDRLRWMIIGGLEKLERADRAKLLKNAIRKARDLTVLVDVVRDVVRDKHPDGIQDRQTRADVGDEAENIRADLLARIRAILPNGRIWDQARPSRLLWFWWGSDLEAEVQAFTKRAMRTKKGFLGLLDATVSSITSSSEGTYEHIDKGSWSKLVDIDALIAKAKRTDTSKLNEDERAIIARFLTAATRP